MIKRTLTIGNEEIKFDGMIFSKVFGLLLWLTLLSVLIASLKYIFS